MSSASTVAGSITAAGGTLTGYITYKSIDYVTVSDILFQESKILTGDRKGLEIPIDQLSQQDQDSWWIKAYHRYSLEYRGSDEVPSVIDIDFSISGWKNFKYTCLAFLSMPKEDKESERIVRRWCVTYRTVKDDGEYGNKELDSDNGNKSKWVEKFDDAKGVGKDADVKRIIGQIKKRNFRNEKDKDLKKVLAMKKWCEMALDAENEKFKTLVNENCLFKETKND